MQNRPTTPTNRPATAGHPNPAAAHLERLDDLDDFKVADGDPDIRGWAVRAADGRKIGEVDSLIVDTGAMRVRYLDVDLDSDALKLKDDRHVLVPISDARLDDRTDDVLLRAFTAPQLAALPPYRHGEAIKADSAPVDHDAEARKFYGKRQGSGRVQRLTLSEEELRVGKRPTSGGEARVGKSVETRHVERKVPLAHEELVVKTRPIEPGTPARQEIAPGEVRIPLMEEEAVVDKRTVAREEVVISKKLVEEDKTVEADLRREELDVDRGTAGKAKGKKH